MRGQRIMFTGPHRAVWEEVELPEHLGPHEVLLKTCWSAVSAGTEMAIYTGAHIGFSIPEATYPRYPHSPGYAAVGEVLATGSEVRGISVGEEVCFPGNHSSHVVWDARKQPLVRVPTGLSPDLAALAYLCNISLNGVRLGRISLGDTVIVLGAGLIGQFAAQFARLSGGHPVVVSDLIPDRLRAARECGIRETINPRERDVLAAGRELTNGRAFDVVLEATGAPSAVEQAFTLAAEMGRVVLLGSPRGQVTIDPYTHIHRAGVTVVGAHARTTPSVETVHSRWTRQSNFELALNLLRAGDLVAKPLISHRLPAASAVEVYEGLEQHPDKYLGILLDWSVFDPAVIQ